MIVLGLVKLSMQKIYLSPKEEEVDLERIVIFRKRQNLIQKEDNLDEDACLLRKPLIKKNQDQMTVKLGFC